MGVAVVLFCHRRALYNSSDVDSVCGDLFELDVAEYGLHILFIFSRLFGAATGTSTSVLVDRPSVV